MKLNMGLELLYHEEPEDTCTMSEFLDDMMVLLKKEGQVRSPSLIADVEGNRVIVSLFMDTHGDDWGQAFSDGFSAIRSAIHACGGKTHGWDHFVVNRTSMSPATKPLKQPVHA
jgi:hypothetical protein